MTLATSGRRPSVSICSAVMPVTAAIFASVAAGACTGANTPEEMFW